MRLLKLSASHPRFKTLIFNPGLNIVAGLQLTGSDRKTYNGIGKSFSLYLIHLMFGAKPETSTRKGKKIMEFLSGYGTFSLAFSHRGLPHNIQKDFSESHFYFDGEKISQTNYPDHLRSVLFGSTLDPMITVKQLLNIFARRYGESYYNDAITQQGRPATDYYQMTANLALLGVDVQLINDKAKIKEELNNIKKARKSIEHYQKKEAKPNTQALRDGLEQLKRDKQAFAIAPSYDALKKEADLKTEELTRLREEINRINTAIANKERYVKQTNDIDFDLDKIKQVYAEANMLFADKVVKSLEEANAFYQSQTRSRFKKYESEICALEKQLTECTAKLKDKESVRDKLIEQLSQRGALEEYHAIEEQIRAKESELYELEKFESVLQTLKDKESQLSLDNAAFKAASMAYCTQQAAYFSSLETIFTGLVKRFYTHDGGSLTISPSEDAKYLFNIDPHIPRDGAQGITSVKVFCYDFLLYELNPDLLAFIAHDGCLFSEMDPRQKSMIFKIVLEYVENHDLQYFVNIGESSLNEILDVENKLGILTEADKEAIKNSIILQLYDKEPGKWLFGEAFG